MANNRNYELTIYADRLEFRTPRFKAEKGSVLHTEIYNRELASLVASSMVSGAVFVALALSYRVRFFHYILVFVLFVLGFVFFRIFVFRERSLIMDISKESGEVTLKYPSLTGRRVEGFSIGDIESVEVSHAELMPENIEGIKIVEKVALQHGTVIPGFGRKLVLFPVELKIKDGSRRIIYVDEIHEKSEAVADSIKGFLKIA